MLPLFSRAKTGALVVLVGGAAIIAGVERIVVPTAMGLSTYAALVSLAVGLAAVTLSAARNARPTGSLGQLLYETDHPSLARGDR